jgi:Xaa-Pro aminopeptidase
VRPAFEKYKGIGVRIEDDMQVTADGVRWMSEALPRKISDIEDFIAKARRQSEYGINVFERCFVATLRTTSGLFEKTRAVVAAHPPELLLPRPNS